MKLFERKALVYRSKDPEDFQRAKALLEEAGIAFSPYETEEAPAAGCGAKIDVRKYSGAPRVPDRIYRIEVAMADRPAAEAALEGKVLPVKSYGFTV